jgi:hypothetical protein
VNAATVAVDASPNPYVATAAAYVGVKPSTLIGGGLTLAAVALSAYAAAGPSRRDTGYAAFDREAGRTDRGRDGGRAGREQQRAFLEKQLAADRDAQRARWRSAMDDGSGGDASTSAETSSESATSSKVGAGARMRSMFGLGDAAKRADGETSGSGSGLSEDETADARRRLERIREMNRLSGDATAAAEAKLREAKRKSESESDADESESDRDGATPGATATVSAADRRRAEVKARAEKAVLSEYQTGEDDADAGWDAKEVEEMSKKYKAFLKASKAKKWWSRGD